MPHASARPAGVPKVRVRKCWRDLSNLSCRLCQLEMHQAYLSSTLCLCEAIRRALVRRIFTNFSVTSKIMLFKDIHFEDNSHTAAPKIMHFQHPPETISDRHSKVKVLDFGAPIVLRSQIVSVHVLADVRLPTVCRSWKPQLRRRFAPHPPRERECTLRERNRRGAW